jgi:hypothetical protein
MTAQATNGPTPNTSVTAVPDAPTATVMCFLVCRVVPVVTDAMTATRPGVNTRMLLAVEAIR